MATPSRIEHSIQNIRWNIILTAVITGLPFIIRTLIIRFWGLEYLGLNSLFSSILQVLNVSELGIGSALVYNMYQPVAEEDDNKVSMLLSLYNLFYKALGMGILFVGLLLIPFLPKLISGTYPEGINIYFVYFVFLLQTVLSYLVEAYCQAAFQANQISYVTAKSATIVWAIIYCIQIAIIIIVKNYYWYVVWLPVITILINSIQFIYFKKFFPQYKVHMLKRNEFPLKFWKDFAKRVFGIALSKIRISIRNSIDIIVISMFLGLAMVAKYQNYLLVMSVFSMLIGAFTNGVLPSLGNGMAKETSENNLRVLNLISFGIHWIGTILTAFFICFSQPFMNLWAGEKNTLSIEAVILFAIYFYLKCLTEISQLARNTSGIWWEGKWVSIVETIVNIVFNFVFVNIFGIEGVILATILSLIMINIPFETYYVYKECFGEKLWGVIRTYLKQGIVSIIAVSCTFMLTRLYHKGWIDTFIVWGIGCLTIPNVILLLFYWRNSDFVAYVDIFKGLVRKK